mmetsp:Transcript_6793/g.10252  ORF Transcript_6793/g.10252 Transcript_6793/m.10252 type:complete len:124 (+) Transcript_6793:47-418(+)
MTTAELLYTPTFGWGSASSSSGQILPNGRETKRFSQRDGTTCHLKQKEEVKRIYAMIKKLGTIPRKREQRSFQSSRKKKMKNELDSGNNTPPKKKNMGVVSRCSKRYGGRIFFARHWFGPWVM